MASAEYENTRAISVELDGVQYAGSWRVMTGNVIVYFENEIRFARHEMNRPELIARWLFTDLCRRVDARRRKHAGK